MLAGLTKQSSRLALTIPYASYLLAHQSEDEGLALLAEILIIAETPRPAQADARLLLRQHWRQSPNTVERAWQATARSTLPDWVHLTDDHINMVIGWINAQTWTQSREYFKKYIVELLNDTTSTTLDELSLRVSSPIIAQHRALLDAVRTQGLDTAYRPLVLADTLREWITSPDLDTSRTYLHEHLELLSHEGPGILDELSNDPNPAISIHWALLTLTKTSADIDRVYQCLTIEPALHAILTEAITTRDAGGIQACAIIEALVHDRMFASTLHHALANLLVAPTTPLPDDSASRLRALAAQADPAERDSALAEFDTLLASLPISAAIANQLRQALGLRRDPRLPM